MKLLLILAAIVVTTAASTGKEPIRPTLHASNSSDMTGEFLNGISGKCPPGMAVVDPKHLMHDHMSYQETMNGFFALECETKPNVLP